VGTESFTVLAEELEGTARAELWPKLVARYPTVGEHQAKCLFLIFIGCGRGGGS
jgi:hypothetical protein